MLTELIRYELVTASAIHLAMVDRLHDCKKSLLNQNVSSDLHFLVHILACKSVRTFSTIILNANSKQAAKKVVMKAFSI